jgi:hypothetical protein
MTSPVDLENHDELLTDNAGEDVEKDLAAEMLRAGAESLKGGSGVRIAGWTIRTRKGHILKMDQVDRYFRSHC